MLEKFNPDLYSAKDAQVQYDKIKDPEYSLGDKSFNPDQEFDQSRIWSIEPNTLGKIKDIVDNAGHWQPLPFVMGTYSMNSREMRMNDFSLSDPYLLYMAANGKIEGLAIPLLRGFYYLNRKGWWRHESLHARHHHQMADFITMKESDDGTSSGSRKNLEIAGETIHESGIEEIVTRWQALKEANGLREKAMSSLALALYMEYTPFTGLRNATIDAKEVTVDKIDNTLLRRGTKLGISLGSLTLPTLIANETGLAEKASQMLDEALPFTQDQIENAFYRGLAYVGIAVVGAMLSSKEKGEFVKEGEDRVPTSEYKFPYAYNPATAVVRSLDLLLYLNRVWDNIPNFRYLSEFNDLDKVKREIDDKVSENMNSRDHKFTMNVIEDALEPVEKRKKSKYPYNSVYVKGMFTSSLYLNLRDRYYSADFSEDSKEQVIFESEN